jgi:hypothetical protein
MQNVRRKSKSPLRRKQRAKSKSKSKRGLRGGAPPIHVYARVEGSGALAQQVDLLHEGDVAVFDYDRTITNVKNMTFNKSSEAANIRGGELTLTALREAKTRGVHMFIVSARGGNNLDSVVLAIRRTPTVENVFDVSGRFESTQILDGTTGSDEKRFLGHVYCVGYNKPFAIQHLLQRLEMTRQDQKPHKLLFMDDFSQNAMDVWQTADSGTFAAVAPSVSVTALWWDTIEEEKSGEVVPSQIDGTENSYSALNFPFIIKFFSSESEALAKQAEVFANTILKKTEADRKRALALAVPAQPKTPPVDLFAFPAFCGMH